MYALLYQHPKGICVGISSIYSHLGPSRRFHRIPFCWIGRLDKKYSCPLERSGERQHRGKEQGYSEHERAGRQGRRSSGGAASQGFTDYPVLVLVGAGIGITPMISVLKQLVLEPGKLKRASFYWTVRDRASFEWFAKLMDEIYESDHQHMVPCSCIMPLMLSTKRPILT
jgi:hypothetical protein